MAGQDPAAFGAWTFREIDVICSGAARRDARLAWMSALYVRARDPGEDPALRDGPSARREWTEDESAEAMRAFFLKLKMQKDRECRP